MLATTGEGPSSDGDWRCPAKSSNALFVLTSCVFTSLQALETFLLRTQRSRLSREATNWVEALCYALTCLRRWGGQRGEQSKRGARQDILRPKASIPRLVVARPRQLGRERRRFYRYQTCVCANKFYLDPLCHALIAEVTCPASYLPRLPAPKHPEKHSQH